MAELVEERTSRRWPRVLAVTAALLALALLGLWVERKPIARGEADRLLAKAGVPARYTLADLGPGRQRLTDVVIGDPRRPDLVADWIETRTAWGWRGPYLAGVRGGRVRVRARWADGRLSLGGIDRLLPTGRGGGRLTLPALALDVADLRARVETPWGVLGAKLAGRGRLDGGFDGRLAVAAARLGGDCGATRPEGMWRVRTAAGLIGPARVTLEGSAQAAGLRCSGATTGYANANGTATVTLGDRLGWSVRQDVAVTNPRHAAARARALAGRIALTDGRGPVRLEAADLAGAGFGASKVVLDGDFRGSATPAFDGALRWTNGRYAGAVGPALATTSAGTPVQPLVRRLATAIVAAARSFDGEARLSATAASAQLRLAAARSRSGGMLDWQGGAGPIWSAGDGWRLNGTARLAGGGLPSAIVRLAGRPGALAGTASVAPYAAGGARLALTPVRMRQADGRWRIETRAELSGPLAGGRVDALAMPLDLRLAGGAVTLAGGCAPLSWRRLAVAGLRLEPATLRLCPTSGALASIVGGRIGGGAAIAAARLTGRLGSSPLALVLGGAQLRLAERSFALTGVDARLGAADRQTRLTAATLDGRFDGEGVSGRFGAAGGRIGAVPLVMSGAAGDWRFAGGALTVGGGLTVSDTATPARFQPMAAREVRFRLAGNAITATGTLHEPTTGTRVAAVAIDHALAAGTGHAHLAVNDLRFAKGFQPDLLTRSVFGVIADVRGAVDGEGEIAWSPAGVTSTGVFRTAGADLAAAFGPVTGLAGEVRFTDLLALQSAPGQRVTVKQINPGVPVSDGVVTFQTLPGARLRIENARWPFAGGELALDPTLLDFSGAAERRMTFHVTGAEADRFLQSFDFKNLNATGTFDGVLPMVFDTSGGRIAGGRLTARAGGGTIAYVGELSRKNLGFWGGFAFDALRSLRYRQLGVVMDGPLAGEMVTEVRFAGISQGEGAKSNFLIRRLQRLPIAFNIRIRAPFRGLLDATASFYDPKRLIERNLPELIRRQNQGVQPSASETMR